MSAPAIVSLHWGHDDHDAIAVKGHGHAPEVLRDACAAEGFRSYASTTDIWVCRVPDRSGRIGMRWVQVPASNRRAQAWTLLEGLSHRDREPAMTAEQLTLDACAHVPSETAPPERRIAQAAHDEIAAMISAVIGAIPMVGHRKGTARETLQRPVAYLYACRDRLDRRDGELVITICSRITRETPEDLRTIEGPRVSTVGTKTRPVWLRMNGEGVGTWGNGRESFRIFDGTPERDGYAWALNIAQRCPPDFRAAFKSAQAELRELAPEMLGTLAGWLLVLRWTPALALVSKWRRRSGCSLGPEMLVRRDQALAAGHVPEDEHGETYRLAQLDPATSMLARAVMAVPPRGDS